VDFCFENMIETLLAQFLQSLGTLDGEVRFEKGTYFKDGSSSVAELTYRLWLALLRRWWYGSALGLLSVSSHDCLMSLWLDLFAIAPQTFQSRKSRDLTPQFPAILLTQKLMTQK
jgi:hypothetical protein